MSIKLYCLISAVSYSVHSTQLMRQLGWEISSRWQIGRRVATAHRPHREKVYTTGTATHTEARPRGAVSVLMCFRPGLSVQRWWAGVTDWQESIPWATGLLLTTQPSQIHSSPPSSVPSTASAFPYMSISSPLFHTTPHIHLSPAPLTPPPQYPFVEMACWPNSSLIPWFSSM